MPTLQAKRFESPDEVRPFKNQMGKVELVELAGNMVGYGTFEPGWRWSEHVKPLSGTDSCQVEHIGHVLKGRMKVAMDRTMAKNSRSAPATCSTCPPDTTPGPSARTHASCSTSADYTATPNRADTSTKPTEPMSRSNRASCWSTAPGTTHENGDPLRTILDRNGHRAVAVDLPSDNLAS